MADLIGFLEGKLIGVIRSNHVYKIDNLNDKQLIPIMRSQMRFFIIISILLCCHSVLYANEFKSNIDYSSKNAKSILEIYLQHDFSGKSLSSKTNWIFQPLVAWQNTPGWDVIIGVQSYSITEISMNDDTARFEVTYYKLAVWPPGYAEPFQMEAIEKKTIELRKIQNMWKIITGPFAPHVSQTYICKKFNQCLHTK